MRGPDGAGEPRASGRDKRRRRPSQAVSWPDLSATGLPRPQAGLMGLSGSSRPFSDGDGRADVRDCRRVGSLGLSGNTAIRQVGRDEPGRALRRLSFADGRCLLRKLRPQPSQLSPKALPSDTQGHRQRRDGPHGNTASTLSTGTQHCTGTQGAPPSGTGSLPPRCRIRNRESHLVAPGKPQCRLAASRPPCSSERRRCYTSRTLPVWSTPASLSRAQPPTHLGSKRFVAASRALVINLLCLGSFHHSFYHLMFCFAPPSPYPPLSS